METAESAKTSLNWPEPTQVIEESEEVGLPDWGKHLGLWEVQKIMLPSRGTHLYCDSSKVPGSYANVLPAPSCMETYVEQRQVGASP